MKRPYPIFLRAKQKWRKFDDAWFITSPVGRSWLHLIVDKLTVSFHELKGKALSNKIGMGFGIDSLCYFIAFLAPIPLVHDFVSPQNKVPDGALVQEKTIDGAPTFALN